MIVTVFQSLCHSRVDGMTQFGARSCMLTVSAVNRP